MFRRLINAARTAAYRIRHFDAVERELNAYALGSSIDKATAADLAKRLGQAKRRVRDLEGEVESWRAAASIAEAMRNKAAAERDSAIDGALGEIAADTVGGDLARGVAQITAMRVRSLVRAPSARSTVSVVADLVRFADELQAAADELAKQATRYCTAGIRPQRAADRDRDNLIGAANKVADMVDRRSKG